MFSLIIFLALAVSSAPIDKYYQRRASLVSAVEEQRFDNESRSGLSSAELRANASICAMRNAIRYNATFFPEAPFYQLKDYYSSTPLFQALAAMPKGSILHIHFDSILPLEWLVQQTHRPFCWVYWNEEAKNSSHVKGQLVFAPSSPGEGWMLTQTMRDSNANFDQELLALLDVMGGCIRSQTGNCTDSVKRWNYFGRYFQMVENMIRYFPVFQASYQQVFKDAVTVWNVQAVELRIDLLDGLIYDLTSKVYTGADMVRIIRSVSQQATMAMPSFLGVKLIGTVSRRQTTATVSHYMDVVVQLIKDFPDYVIGFDAVGPEDKGLPLSHFTDILVDAQSKYGLQYYFHAGETNEASGPEPTTATNVIDAVLLGKRIGHGLAMSKFPAVSEMAKKNGIAVEVCPLSNQVLGFVPDPRMHPATNLLAAGIPITISPDDPAIIGYETVTYDWVVAFVNWDLDLASLKQLAKNSIVYSGMSADEKKQGLIVWESLWQSWVVSMLAEPL